MVSAAAESQPARAETSEREWQLTLRLARGASIYVMGLLVGKGLTVVLQVIMGRWLGSAAYGVYELGDSIGGKPCSAAGVPQAIGLDGNSRALVLGARYRGYDGCR